LFVAAAPPWRCPLSFDDLRFVATAKHCNATSEKQSIIQVTTNYGSYSICRREFQTCKLVWILILTQLKLCARFVTQQLTPDSWNDLLVYVVPTLHFLCYGT
jgi:hypothetical protein